MNDHHYRNVVSSDYETIRENGMINIMGDEFENYMTILIAREIGIIPRNYVVC